MRWSAALMFAATLTVTIGGHADLASARQRWAALTPDSEGRAHFGWGSTRAKADAAALRVCRRVSKTCAVPPGSTPDLGDIFAMMCCTNPRFGCAVYPAKTRKEARENVTGIFVKAHFANCELKGYYSARTGKRL